MDGEGIDSVKRVEEEVQKEQDIKILGEIFKRSVEDVLCDSGASW